MPHIIDPWGAELPADYDRLIHEFGLEVFDPKIFPGPNVPMRRMVCFAGRDLKRIASCIAEKKPYYALTGIMPSAERIHFGTKTVIENIRYFQEHGAKTYVLVADLEAMMTRKVSLAEAQRRALEFHIPAYIALGLDAKKTTFYFQSENKQVMKLAYSFAPRVTTNEFRALYGTMDAPRMLSALTQAGDIFWPQLEERMPCVIPVGIDQDPHIRLSRDLAVRTRKEFNFIPPSALFHKFTPGLDGSLKMSKSKPSSCIELPEEPDLACKKIISAVSGGRETINEHRRLGGIPEKDMAFELLKIHLLPKDEELNKIYNDYKTGKLLTSELKQITCELFERFMRDFEERFERAKKIVSRLRFFRREI